MSGIAKYYSPEEMKAKDVVVVTNLNLLNWVVSLARDVVCAEDTSGNVVLLSPEKAVDSGSKIS